MLVDSDRFDNHGTVKHSFVELPMIVDLAYLSRAYYGISCS